MKRIAILAVFAGLFAFNASSQLTSEIAGRVTDPGGGVIPGAQVTATNTDTNIVKTAQTAENGEYVLPQLSVGPYRLEVKKDGFQAYIQTGIVLEVSTNPTINVSLQVGNLTQSVEVQADAAMVETQSTGVGQVIEPEQVVDLPLNDRQVSQLIGLSGAALSNPGSFGGNLGYPTTIGYSIAGSQGNETNYNLDGSPNMDFRTNIGAPLPFPDALQEFKVETNALPANVGSRPGGSVGAVTKSGTNAFHGDLFEFLRNGIMNADSYQFGNTADVVTKGVQDTLKRNQFGGVIGGPIRKNKLFFFYGFQGTEERSITTGTTSGLPTPAVLKGDFTAFLAPPCQSKQIFLNPTVPSPIDGTPQQFTTAPNSNIILPQWLITPSAQISAKIAALLPTPNDACGDYATVKHNINSEFQHVARVDWQRTQKDSIFFRYFFTNYSNPDYFVPGNLILNTGPGLADRVQNVSLGDTYSVTATMINSLRLTFARSAAQRTSVDGIPSICTLGMNAWCQLPHFLSYDFGAPGNLGWVYGDTYGVNDTFAWQRHSHNISFGFTYNLAQVNNDGVYQVNPLPTVKTGATTSYTGQALAGFVTGFADGYSQGGGQLGRDAENYPALFVQDNWKVAPRFQVNLGLRWDPFFPQHNKYKMVSSFNLADYNNDVVSKVYPNSPPGITYPGDAGFNGTSVLPNHLPNFSPRIGIVWDPSGKGTMSVRAGYGLAYSTTAEWNQMHVVLNPPYGETISFTPAPINVSSSNPLSGGGVANPWYGQTNPFPVQEPPPSSVTFPLGGGYVFLNKNNQPAHTQSWNVSVQDQLTRNWLVTGTYIGNKSSNQWLGQNINQSVIITAGMTAPGIVSTAGMVGTSGPCTLKYGADSLTFATCNGGTTDQVKNSAGVFVNSESARTALNLSNPKWGPYLAAAPGASVNGTIIGNTNGYSNYDGLLLSTQHRLSHGFSILANYTLSHCLDLGEIGQDVTNSYQNPQNTAAEYGNCSQDRRHLVNVSLVLITPRLSNHRMDSLLGGWTTSQIFTLSSGSPYNVTDGTDQSLSSINSDRPNLVGNPLVAGPVAANPTCVAPTVIGTERAYFNPCAFVLQPLGTFGNEGRNILYGPGRYNIDSAIWRTFRIREKYRLDFRGEAFNILNHANWGNPSSSLSGTMGLITGPNGAARILQVAMKLNF